VQRIGNICSMNATTTKDTSKGIEHYGLTVNQADFQYTTGQFHIAEGCPPRIMSGQATLYPENSNVESAIALARDTAVLGGSNHVPTISTSIQLENSADDNSSWRCGLRAASHELEEDGQLRTAIDEMDLILDLPLFDRSWRGVQNGTAWVPGATDLSGSLEVPTQRRAPCISEPSLPCLARLPCPRTAAIGVFDIWLQHVLTSYGGSLRDRLNTLLPPSPCLGALFAPTHCQHTLSRELGDILRRRYPSGDIVNLTGAFWSLHMLLRYYLAPGEDELSQTPSNMRPIPKQQVFALNWVHFLPWPHIRQALIIEPKRLLGTEFERVISEGIYLDWPLGLGEAIIFNSTGVTMEDSSIHNSHKCASVSLTDTFKSHIAQAHNWCLKPIVPDLRIRFPVLDIITR
jgi:hypothetical protein